MSLGFFMGLWTVADLLASPSFSARRRTPAEASAIIAACNNGVNRVTDNTLIALLADGEFHSGEEVGALLGVSRTAVWKQFKKLENLGLALEAQKGRGYRIVGGLDLLDADKIRAALKGGAEGNAASFDIFSTIDSTNRIAAAKAVAGGAHGYFCLAEQQTAGRGRRGRSWLSPFGRNVYLSLVWEFQDGAAALEGLSLAVGVVLVEVLEAFGVSAARLKWPNDVLYDDKKLAGILLEMHGDPAGICQVVIGIGVNLDFGAEGLEVDQPATDLASIVGVVDRNQFIATLLVRLQGGLGDFGLGGFPVFRQRWLQLDAFVDQPVSLHMGDQCLDGLARGVDNSGALQLELAGELKSFSGGELSLRRRAGGN